MKKEISLFEYWKQCWVNNFINFEGRARRREYWGFILFNFLIVIPISLALALGSTFVSSAPLALLLTTLQIILSLIVTIPNIAVSVRRLHDLGKSGWWMFLSLIPGIGGLILLVWFMLEGNRHDNVYGPDPKAETISE